MLLPSYTIDVWVTGSDESGNPYDSQGNTISDPLASWPLALTGPEISLRAADTVWSWSNPTPTPGEEVTLTVDARNNGASGNVTFVLQEYVGDSNWKTIDTTSVEVSNGKSIQVTLETTVGNEISRTFEYRLLLLDTGVEKERISIAPLMIKEEVDRDGTALANQVAESQLSVIMYLIALIAMSYAVWTMVQMRRIKRGEDIDESDQTADVVNEMQTKAVPAIHDTQVVQQNPVSTHTYCSNTSSATTATNWTSRRLDYGAMESLWPSIHAESKVKLQG